MYGAGGGGAWPASGAGRGGRGSEAPVPLGRHVSWGNNAASDAAFGAQPGSEARPLLAGTLRASRSGSFARLKSLSLGGYDGAASDAGDADFAPGGPGGGDFDRRSGAPAGGPGDGASGGPRRAWHRCHAVLGAPPAFVAHFALGTGTFVQGYDQTALGFLIATGYGGHIPLSSWQQGMVVSIFFAGGVVGAWMSASMNDISGRRAPLLAAAALVTVTALLGTTTTFFTWLLAVRTAFGIAMGMNNASLAIYLAEITPTRQRGGVVAMTELLFALGGVLACFVQLALQAGWSGEAGQRNGWRVLVGLESLGGCIMLAGSVRCVESPRWLLQKGRDWDAERILLRIYASERRRDGGCTCAARNAELAEAVESLRTQLDAADDEADAPKPPGGALGATLALLASPERRVRRALEISIVMATVPLIGIGCIPQQFVPLVLGVASTTKKRDAGAIPLQTLFIDLACNLIYTVGAGLQSMVLADRIGRRMPLFTAMAGAAVGFALDAAVFAGGGVTAGDTSKRHAALALSGVALGYACRAVGIGPLPQVVGAEVIPLKILTRGKAVATMIRRCCAMLYCLLLPPAIAVLGGDAVFQSQALLSACYALYVWLRLPETKGYEISEIESILEFTEWVGARVMHVAACLRVLTCVRCPCRLRRCPLRRRRPRPPTPTRSASPPRAPRCAVAASPSSCPRGRRQKRKGIPRRRMAQLGTMLRRRRAARAALPGRTMCGAATAHGATGHESLCVCRIKSMRPVITSLVAVHWRRIRRHSRAVRQPLRQRELAVRVHVEDVENET
jgi:MFS family permease